MLTSKLCPIASGKHQLNGEKPVHRATVKQDIKGHMPGNASEANNIAGMLIYEHGGCSDAL